MCDRNVTEWTDMCVCVRVRQDMEGCVCVYDRNVTEGQEEWGKVLGGVRPVEPGGTAQVGTGVSL